jgi:hypothetical protein
MTHKELPYSVARGQIVRGDSFIGAVAAVGALNRLDEQYEGCKHNVKAPSETSDPATNVGSSKSRSNETGPSMEASNPTRER